MPAKFLIQRPWIALQALGALVMLHGCALLFFIERPPSVQLAAMGWIFLSLGVLGAVLGLLARHWIGSPVIAAGGVVKLFGAIALFAMAPGRNRVVYISIALVILVAGILHMLGALRLRRVEQKYAPFVASGMMNIIISSLALSSFHQKIDLFAVPLVAGSAVTTGMTLFYYGRLLRRIASVNVLVMEQLQALQVPATRHSRLRI